MKTKLRLCLFTAIGLMSIATSCKKKDSPIATPAPVTPTGATMTDMDNNVYYIVTIGTQTWMAENLKVTKYRNGNPIPSVADSTWGKLTTGAYCNYYNNTANVATYGRLYNWYAVNDVRNIAPTGWHVASDAEWTTLTNYVNSVNSGINQGKALSAKSGWNVSTTVSCVGNDQGSNNSTGFSALPSGYHSMDGNYYYLQEMAIWWSSTQADSVNAYDRSIYYDYDVVNPSKASRGFGYSVRCVKD